MLFDGTGRAGGAFLSHAKGSMQAAGDGRAVPLQEEGAPGQMEQRVAHTEWEIMHTYCAEPRSSQSFATEPSR